MPVPDRYACVCMRVWTRRSSHERMTRRVDAHFGTPASSFLATTLLSRPHTLRLAFPINHIIQRRIQLAKPPLIGRFACIRSSRASPTVFTKTHPRAHKLSCHPVLATALLSTRPRTARNGGQHGGPSHVGRLPDVRRSRRPVD